MGLLENDDLFPQAGAVKLLAVVGMVDSGVTTDVPGFWSVNGLKVTVWTSMIAVLLIFGVELRDLGELRREGGRGLRFAAGIKVGWKAEGGDQRHHSSAGSCSPVASQSALHNHSAAKSIFREKQRAIYVSRFLFSDFITSPVAGRSNSYRRPLLQSTPIYQIARYEAASSLGPRAERRESSISLLPPSGC